METHYLSPLFSPKSMVVFAGKADAPDGQTGYGRSIRAQLEQGGFAGPVTFLDVGMSGTLADLAQSRADLAIIALPNDELAFALQQVEQVLFALMCEHIFS